MTRSVVVGRESAEDEVIEALLAVSRVLVAISARSLGQLDSDVTLQQYRTLVVLVSRGPQRVVDLAQELAVQPSTATRMCNRLVRKGLVARHARPTDRRAAWMALTPAGKELVGLVMQRRRAEIGHLVRELELVRPTAFAGVLHAFVEAAGEVPGPQWWARWKASAGDGDPAGDHPG